MQSSGHLPIFWKWILSARSFKLLQNTFTWPPVSQVGSLLWPMWLWRVIDREGLSSIRFVLPPPFPSLSCHACKCCPVIGYCVLTNFIITNWAKVIGVMLKVLEYKKQKQPVRRTCIHLIILRPSLSLIYPVTWPVSLSLSLTLSFTVDCLQLRSFQAHYTCGRSSNSITSGLLVMRLEMIQ